MPPPPSPATRLALLLVRNDAGPLFLGRACTRPNRGKLLGRLRAHLGAGVVTRLSGGATAFACLPRTGVTSKFFRNIDQPLYGVVQKQGYTNCDPVMCSEERVDSRTRALRQHGPYID